MLTLAGITEPWRILGPYIVVALLSGSAGYLISSTSKQRTLSTPATKMNVASNAADDAESSGESVDGDLSAIRPGIADECKLVLVVRTDLGMTKGKIAAQCSHATLACYKSLVKSNPSLLRHWERTGQAKIALRCDSEDELLLLQATAQGLNICARTIQDAGRTQIAAGSRTVLGIGPAPVKLVNSVTGALKLL